MTPTGIIHLHSDRLRYIDRFLKNYFANSIKRYIFAISFGHVWLCQDTIGQKPIKFGKRVSTDNTVCKVGIRPALIYFCLFHSFLKTNIKSFLKALPLTTFISRLLLRRITSSRFEFCSNAVRNSDAM